MTRIVPISILTGFLGAGKTSLLNRLLADPALSDAAVIINEFGDVGLDHLLVEATTDGIIELSSGCLCCTVRGDLIDTLENFLDRLSTGQLKSLSRIVIETTGLADPVPVLQAVLAHPLFQGRYRVDQVITLVDAINGEQTLAQHEEARRQASVADTLVLTKTDLPDAIEKVGKLFSNLKALNPSARILDNQKDQPDASVLFSGDPFDPDTKAPNVRQWLNTDGFHEHDHSHHDHGHDHDHGHSHHHHHHDTNRHGDSIRSFAIEKDVTMSGAALEMAVNLLASAHGPKLLRMKGIVPVSDHPDKPVVLHGVQNVFHPPRILDKWPDDDRRLKLVFIVDGLDEAFVRELFDAFSDTVQIDRPDAQALTDNPLAVPGKTF
ncbi:CobW family GTP-binding protein [Coralliovum pocilloporae]|uniref:CobW family GTP-binding protein n=1 Tax=Coralliovum pocilloporae TaxID=3066369 RepID=UPI003306BCED